jgi:hypothetical protein
MISGNKSFPDYSSLICNWDPLGGQWFATIVKYLAYLGIVEENAIIQLRVA